MKSKLVYFIPLVLASASAHAVELVVNGTFEQGTFDYSQHPHGDTNLYDLNPGNTDLTGWTIGGGKDIAWIENGNNYNIVTPFGNRSLDLTGYTNTYPTGTLSQVLNTQVGQTYTLSFDLGVNNDNPLLSGPISVAVGFGSYTGVATDLNTNPGNQWNHYTYQIVGTSTGEVLTFAGLSGAAQVELDNVSVTAATPEPATLAILGIGALAALKRRRS